MRWFPIILIIAVLILLLVAILSKVQNVPVYDLTRDPAATTGISSITGVLSNLGVLLWCATATTCLFSVFILRKAEKGRTNWFLVSGAVLTIFLMIDDLFMFHEFLSDSNSWFGERKLYLILAILIVIYLIKFRRIILETNYVYLLLSLGFLGSSLLIDALLAEFIESPIGEWMYFTEDGLKWLGIVCWISYYADTSGKFLSYYLRKGT